MIFAEVLPLEIFASRHLRSSLFSFTTNLLFAIIIALVGWTRHGKNQSSRKIATPLFSWCKPLVPKLHPGAWGGYVNPPDGPRRRARRSRNPCTRCRTQSFKPFCGGCARRPYASTPRAQARPRPRG